MISALLHCKKSLIICKSSLHIQEFIHHIFQSSLQRYITTRVLILEVTGVYIICGSVLTLWKRMALYDVTKYLNTVLYLAPKKHSFKDFQVC